MKTNQFRSLLDIVKRFPTEESCHAYLAKTRWNGSPVCVHCGSLRKIYKVNGGKLFKCADCRKQFTVRIGTIFEDSPLPLQKWFMAFYILTAHKKGISSIQLSKDIGVTQKTAWFMLHRIRYAIKTKSFNKPLNGVVEIDETYVGGKTHGKGRGYQQPNKTAVFGMMQRKGEVRVQPVKHADGMTLKPIIRKHISSDAVLMSDEFGGYKDLNKEFKEHNVVIHSKKEYARGGIHVNTIEGFWSLLKRGIVGIYHKTSAEHLHRYCDEFTFRYNNRKMQDAKRFALSLSQCEGRLMYQVLINS